MKEIFLIALGIVVAALIMIGVNILYDLSSAIVPIIAVAMILFGIIVGFAVALKSTISAYISVYRKKGR